jgi:hypothetical protein
MAGPKLADCALVFAFSVAGCGGEARMSPWPGLGLYAERPDLDQRLAAIDLETAGAKLTLEHEARAKSETGDAYVVRSYRGVDLVGRTTWACRAASPYGVVLAVGPGDPAIGSEVVFAADAGGGRIFASPGQLVAGGEPEVLLRNDSGALSVWTLGLRGASPVPIDLVPPPVGVRVLDTGEIVLVAEMTVPSTSDPPLRVAAAAGFSASKFTKDAGTAKRFHAEMEGAYAEPPEGETAAARFDRVTVHAFHAIRAGGDKKAIRERYAKEEVAPELRATHRDRAAWLGR